MYSEEERNIKSNYQLYDDDLYERQGNNKSNKGSIVLKVVIIVICVILLIWLISLLKKSDNNSVVANPSIHNANTTNTRLAAEKYFFINNNLPQGSAKKTVTLKTLINQKLSQNLIDANNKVCDNTKSTISLTKESKYVMRINLSCSTNDKEEVFHYDDKTHICLDCNGKTYMDKSAEKEQDDQKDNIDFNYSCNEWSEWSTERVNNALLQERSRVLVRGIKKGETKENVIYGEWSSWTRDPITASDTLEVETKSESGSGWSSEKTTTEKPSESRNIKIISESTEEHEEKYCPSGYTMQQDKCIQYRHGNLNYINYNSSNISNKSCGAPKTVKNSNGKYELVYQNCSYTVSTNVLTRKVKGKTTYTYKTYQSYSVTYYRSRSVTKELIQDEDVITDEYYELEKLPNGYEKYSNSEKTEYSYKLKSCIK